ADLRLPGQRRVRDAQGRLRKRLARRTRLHAGGADLHQARRRGRHPQLFRAGCRALAERPVGATLASRSSLRKSIATRASLLQSEAPMPRKHYAVFGSPVTHSLSPRIHTAFAKQAGVDMDYVAIEAEDFAAALSAFDGDGASVTLPHKEVAAALCTSLGDRARRCGVVNTLLRTDAGWHGDTTAGSGLVRDLTGRRRLDLRGRRTLLLGAGGGARGVAPALLDAGIADLFIVNRTPGRTDALADALGE